MELKEYQRATLQAVRSYLERVVAVRNVIRDFSAKGESGIELDPAEQAWKTAGGKGDYQPKRDGLGRSIPHFCLKIPTGGGKTFLAVKSLDLIQSIYTGQRTGLVLWIVPTSQIYRQTLNALRDREHPYRQALEVASGGRVKVIERSEGLKRIDVEERLVVMILMLQASSRQTKESLRMFRDSGGYTDFFPPEDDYRAHEELLKQVPNLDFFNEVNVTGKQVKTSLGNVLRITNPVIILDEGQKAYSELAQKTLRGFNPSLILELSATPPSGANILVDILGETLEKEEMIKLPLHVHNKTGADWKETLHDAVKKRDFLEALAKKHEAQTGQYIRPIMLIQAERVGKDQRGKGVIHSDDVREWLTKVKGIEPAHVAIKTAQKDELKELEEVGGLLSKECSVRYIITKQALQEGWDCPFAYVLTVLTNPGSKTALTQLVGRVLRQPEGKKTGVPQLDESYVYCFRPNAGDLLNDIRKGFSREGLDDVAGRIVGAGIEADEDNKRSLVSKPEKKYQKAVNSVLFPIFVTRSGKGWRPLNYVSDIEGKIPWEMVNCNDVADMALERRAAEETEHVIGIGGESESRRKVLDDEEVVIDEHFIVRHLEDIIPNPWVSHEIVERILRHMLKREGSAVVAHNLPTILARLRECLGEKKDELAESLFRQAVKADQFRFLLVKEGGWSFPESIEVESHSRPLLGEDKRPLQKSLFDLVPEESLNPTERAVVWYLDQHEKLFFWYRNRERKDYALQGWKRNRVYPDFIFTTKDSKGGFEKVHVVETKGLHLDNPDTGYKKDLMDLCNKQAAQSDFNQISRMLAGKQFRFNVIFTRDSWRADVNGLIS